MSDGDIDGGGAKAYVHAEYAGEEECDLAGMAGGVILGWEGKLRGHARMLSRTSDE